MLYRSYCCISPDHYIITRTYRLHVHCTDVARPMLIQTSYVAQSVSVSQCVCVCWAEQLHENCVKTAELTARPFGMLTHMGLYGAKIPHWYEIFERDNVGISHVEIFSMTHCAVGRRPVANLCFDNVVIISSITASAV